MNYEGTDILELQALIGTSEAQTDKVLLKVTAKPPSAVLLPIYNLLLLERYDSILPLIKLQLDKNFDLQYILNLQKSKYYIQRKCVYQIIKDINFDSKKTFIKTGLSDPICDVVRSAANSIIYNSPFDSNELLEIAMDLYNHKYISIKMLSVDILILIKESRFLLNDILKNCSWRLRLRAALLLKEFNQNDQQLIISELKADHIDEVRINLCKNIENLDYLFFLKDPCEFVRSSYLFNIINLIKDETTFLELVDDQSWEVKKNLLNLKGEWFKKITIPLIKYSTENVNWRIKFDILILIEEKIENEFVAKLLMQFLIRNLKDKVCAIRTKASEIIIKIMELYGCSDYITEIESVIRSSNYLHRMSVIPVAIAYDMKYKTELRVYLEQDAIFNVKLKFADYLEENKIYFEEGRITDKMPIPKKKSVYYSEETDSYIDSVQEE